MKGKTQDGKICFEEYILRKETVGMQPLLFQYILLMFVIRLRECFYSNAAHCTVCGHGTRKTKLENELKITKIMHFRFG